MPPMGVARRNGSTGDWRAGAPKSSPAGTRFFPVFRDRDELPASADIRQQIMQALDVSDWLIVVCSPGAAKSLWVNAEVDHWLRLGRRSSLVCFVAKGDPSRKAPARHRCLPPAIDAEPLPLAADARRQGDGRERAFARLAAGMLGVGFDDLWQREVARRSNRRAIWISTSLLLLATLALLGGLLVRERMVATKQAASTLVERARNVARKDPARALEIVLEAVRSDPVSSEAAALREEIERCILKPRSTFQLGQPVLEISMLTSHPTIVWVALQNGLVKLKPDSEAEHRLESVGVRWPMEMWSESAMIAARENELRLHRVPSLDLAWEQEFNTNLVAIALSDRNAVAATADGFLHLLNIGTGQPKVRFGEAGQLFCALAISDDGNSVYSAAVDGKISRWSSVSGSIVWQSHVEMVFPGGIQEHPRQDKIVVSSRNSTAIFVMDAIDGTLLETHENCLDVLPHGDGYLLVRNSAPISVQHTGAHRIDATLPDFLASPRISRASDDGKLIALFDGSLGLWLWNTESQELVANYVPRRLLEADVPHCTGLLFSPDSAILAAGFDDAEVTLFDVRSGKAPSKE
jgi:WD40 repeat protein